MLKLDLKKPNNNLWIKRIKVSDRFAPWSFLQVSSRTPTKLYQLMWAGLHAAACGAELRASHTWIWPRKYMWTREVYICSRAEEIPARDDPELSSPPSAHVRNGHSRKDRSTVSVEWVINEHYRMSGTIFKRRKTHLDSMNSSVFRGENEEDVCIRLYWAKMLAVSMYSSVQSNFICSLYFYFVL